MAERLSRLPKTVRRVLDALAVLGRPSSPGEVAGVAALEAIEDARKSGKSYDAIRDAIRKSWKPS